MKNDKESLAKFGRALFEGRKRLNMTIDEISKKSGVASFSIRAYERGKYWPSPDTHTRLVAIFPELANFERAPHPTNNPIIKPKSNPDLTKVISDKASLKVFGAALRKIRSDINMSMKMMANRTGMSIDSIGAYERGDYHPSIENFNKLINAYPNLKTIGYTTPSNHKFKPVGQTNVKRVTGLAAPKKTKKSHHKKVTQPCCHSVMTSTVKSSFVNVFRSFISILENKETQKVVEFLKFMLNTDASLSDVIELLTLNDK